MQDEAFRSKHYDTDVRIGQVGRSDERRKEEFDQQRVPQVVSSEMDLVAVFSQSRGNGRNAGVTDEDVEAGGGEFLGGGLDGGEGGEVAFDEGEFDGGDCGFDGLD